jgi:ABC-type branched-subunit amino acid transport system substrate-binding protein
VTPEAIMQANGMRSRKVTKRQVLKIPADSGTVLASATPVKTEPKQQAAPKQQTAPKQEAAPKAEDKPVPPPTLPTLQDPVIKDPEMVSAGKYKPLKVDKVKVKKADILPPEIPNLGDPEIADPEIAAGNYDPLTVNPVTVDPAQALAGKEEEEEEDDRILDWLTGKGSVEMGLLLPFNAAGRASETNMDFYSGVLAALRDLEAAGIKATLNVYDLQDGVPSALELGKNDFILGPITTTDLTTVLDRTDGRVPVVSPLDQRAADLADARPGFIQAPSSVDSQYTDLAAWAADDLQRDDRIILVTEKVNGSTAPAVGVRNALVDAGTPYEGVSWTVAEGRSLPAALTSRLTKTGVNRIIVASEKEAFVSDMVRNLVILLGRGYKVAMYAPSKVRTFETIDGSTYHQNDLHICSPYFADYDTPAVKSFVRTYRALYRTEPSQFAFQGYDLTHYFASLVSKYGNRWTRAITRVDESGLHTDFHFEKTPAGSFRNTGIRRIVYKTDYSTTLVK